MFKGKISRIEYTISFAFYFLFLTQVAQTLYNDTWFYFDDEYSTISLKLDGEISSKTDLYNYHIGSIDGYTRGDVDGDIDGDIGITGYIRPVINGNEYQKDINIIFWVSFVFLTFFIIVQSIKRCRDIGVSGWYILIPLYPII